MSETETQTNPAYVRLTENNDWEGETWHFYIPLEGNMEALTTLRIRIEAAKATDTYELDLEKRFTRDEIDVLIDADEEAGYMPRHNLLEGRLGIQGITRKTVEDALYKGGIQGRMVAPDPEEEE